MSVYACVVPQRTAAVAVVIAIVAVVMTGAGVGVEAVFEDGVAVAREMSNEGWELPQSANCCCSNRAACLERDRSRAREETQDMNWADCVEASGGPGSWRGMSQGGRNVAP